MSLTHGSGRFEWRSPRIRFACRIALALLLAVVTTAAHASEEWLTNYSEALAAAEETGKPVLAVFTGSDWCQHCRTLERNILETTEFREWAADRVILLMIDLPQEGISSDERKARSRVCIKYGVRSFPNAVLIAPDGSALASQSGYRGQEASTWLATFGQHTPIRTASALTKPEVHSSLGTAVASAKGNRKPILVMVSRPGDASATTRLASLMNDPEFESLASEHFVVARVGKGASESLVGDDAAVAELLGEEELPPAGVQLVITDDGHTPLFKESATHEPRRVVTGLRRFLAGRHHQAVRR